MEQLSRSIVGWLTISLVFLGLAYVGLYAATLFLRMREKRLEGTDAILKSVAMDLTGAIRQIWLFARPIIQLIVILFVAYSFAQILGVTKENIAAFNALDIKTVLAFFVIGAFCIAAFLSENPAHWLKDLALVVIGFYFGTKAGP